MVIITLIVEVKCSAFLLTICCKEEVQWTIEVYHIPVESQYHIVFISKYRKRVLYGKLREDVRDILSTLCKYKDVEIIAGAVCIKEDSRSTAV